jgi:TPP-dependent 2-oxoacid decarboxylase
VDHLFGVQGEFVPGFFNQVLKSNLQHVGTCNELNAVYIADGHARIRGGLEMTWTKNARGVVAPGMGRPAITCEAHRSRQ